MKIAHLAEAFNLPVTSHGAHDVTVHLLAACPNRSYSRPMGSDLNAISSSRSSRRGHGDRAARPGHGVNFDWTALARLSA